MTHISLLPRRRLPRRQGRRGMPRGNLSYQGGIYPVTRVEEEEECPGAATCQSSYNYTAIWVLLYEPFIILNIERRKQGMFSSLSVSILFPQLFVEALISEAKFLLPRHQQIIGFGPSSPIVLSLTWTLSSFRFMKGPFMKASLGDFWN